MVNRIFKKWGLSVFAILVGGICTIISLIVFNLNTLTSIEQFIHQNMEETSETAVYSIEYSFSSFTDMLRQQSHIISLMTNPTDEEIMESLNEFSLDKRFARVSLVTMMEKAYSSQYGIVKTPVDIQTIPNMELNETTIVTRLTNAGELVIDIGTPSYVNGAKIGRLIATVGDNEFSRMYKSRSLQGDAALTIITADGQVISNISERKLPVHVNGNVFDYYLTDDIKFTQSTPENAAADIKGGKTGWLKYKIGKHSFCVHYQPLKINNWYIMISSTDNSPDIQAQDIRKHAAILTITIMLLVCCVAAVILIQRVKEQARVAVLRNTYSLAIMKTNDLFYEINLDNDKLLDHSGAGQAALWTNPPKTYSIALQRTLAACTEECRQEVFNTFSSENIRAKIKEGVSSLNLKYEVLTSDNKARWLSATLVPIVDTDHNSTKLIFMANDITEQVEYQERLHLSATLDGLTGLYNKSTSEKYIDAFLQRDGKNAHHALFLIDIDRFKSINDTLGHAKGDDVIHECGSMLRKIFGKNNIVGRLGGDEFVVLLKNYDTIKLVVKMAREVCNRFHKDYYLTDYPDNKVSSSASIGISLYTAEEDFATLYKNADTALYYTKEHGRDGYRLFSDENGL